MIDEAWFESRGKTLFRSFLNQFATTIVAFEKAGYDPRTMDLDALLNQSRSELKSVSTEDAADILLKQKKGELHIFHLEGAGYMVEYRCSTRSWQVADDHFEDALQRVLDQLVDVEIW